MLIYMVSPRLIVSHILPDKTQEDDFIFDREVSTCKKLGINGYIAKHNTEVQQAKVDGKKKFWRGNHIIDVEFLMRYFSRQVPTRTPITHLQFAM